MADTNNERDESLSENALQLITDYHEAAYEAIQENIGNKPNILLKGAGTIMRGRSWSDPPVPM